MNAYRTIDCEASAQTIIKKSRFIATAWSVASVDLAKQRLLAVCKVNHDASHNCYAYVIGDNREHVKFSDDGEPRGTAGLPILDVLHKKLLTQTLVIVTRYFGGILLGASGLARAYGGACAAVLQRAGTCMMVPVDEVSVTCAYTDYDRLGRFLQSGNVIIKESVYEENVHIRLLSRSESTDALIHGIMDACNGNATCEVRGQIMAPWPLDVADV